MIKKNFLVINFIGKNDCLAIKFKNKFFVKKFQNKINNSDNLVNNILNFLKKKGINLDKNFSVLVNLGPGSYTSLRVSIAVAKGIQIAKETKLFGFKNEQISEFNLENIELLIKSKSLENKLIKPFYTLN
tara:strand:+ start:212 stop:601 length:390 start_codon:yes stop_codon:yes gene_type:complete